MKHDFFIEHLGQPSGWFSAHRYRYSCLRCGWRFLIEGAKPQPVGEHDDPLSSIESSRRVKTFFDGPCEILISRAATHQPQAPKPVSRPKRPAVRRRFDGMAEIIPAR
jgi:hypothetical protein